MDVVVDLNYLELNTTTYRKSIIITLAADLVRVRNTMATCW
jgi:hypothetical protein